MRRRTLVTVVVGALVLLAGCTGGPLGDSTPDATPDGTPDGTETQTDGEPTPEAVDAFVTGDGELDAAALLGAHNETIRNAGTYELTTNASGFLTLDSRVRQDVTTGEVSATLVTQARTSNQYVDADGVQYVRIPGPNGTEYHEIEPPYAENRPEGVFTLNADYRGPIFNDAVTQITGTDWTYDGERSRDGETVYAFTASGVDATAIETAGQSTISGFSAELLVGADGLVHSLQWTVDYDRDGETTTSETAIEFSNVGSATVEEPGWLEQAQTGS